MALFVWPPVGWFAVIFQDFPGNDHLFFGLPSFAFRAGTSMQPRISSFWQRRGEGGAVFVFFFLWLGKVPKAKERCNQEAWMTSGYMLLTFDVAFDDVGVFFFLSWTCFFDPSLKRDLDGTPGTCQTSSHGQELLRQPGSQKMMYGNEILGLKSLNEGLPRSRRYPSPIWTPDSPWDPGELHQVLDSQNGWFI